MKNELLKGGHEIMSSLKKALPEGGQGTMGY
jgi:hypothetical protein